MAFNFIRLMTSIDAQSQEFQKIPRTEYKDKLKKKIQVKWKWEEYGRKERKEAKKKKITKAVKDYFQKSNKA